MGLRKSSMVCLLVAIAVSGVYCKPVEVPAWNPEAGFDSEDILLGQDERGGGDASQDRYYFKELLPCLFERILVLDELPKERAVEWVFTGPRAGFTMEIHPDKVTFYTKYYDSKGFDMLEKHRHYPQISSPIKTFSYTGTLKAVTVKISYHLTLTLLLNGQSVHSQLYLDDIRRHQLRLMGKEGKVSLKMLRPQPVPLDIRVDPARPYQTMLGWGGIGTPPAYRELSTEGRQRWWQYLCEYNLLCQREYPMGGHLNQAMDNWDDIRAARAQYYGDNFPNSEVTDFAYNKIIQDLGGFIMFEFWDLPPWIGSDATKYASAIVNYCQTAQARTGRAPDIVGVQNERQLDEEEVTTFIPALRQALDQAGFRACRIHMSNASTIRTGMQHIDKYLKNKPVWDAIDYAATNMYDYQQYFQNPDGYDTVLKEWRDKVNGKPFIATELGVNNGRFQVDSFRVALNMGQLYHKNLTVMEAVLICYCWTLLNTEQPSFGYTRSLFVTDPENNGMPKPSSHQLRVFGAYSRRIKQGMVRVDADSAHKNVLVTAFKQNDKATLVILNRSLTPVRPTLNWPGVVFDTMETTDPYHPNTVESITLAGESKAATMTVPPGAIVTLTNVPLNRLPMEN